MNPETKNFKSKKMKMPFLGIFQLFWCPSCNLPLLDNFSCNICNSSPKKVLISPPGDIRPAFHRDLIILQECINKQYSPQNLNLGDKIFPTEKIILLNKIGGIDRTEEVIVDGYIMGILQYNPFKNDFEFHPRLICGQYLLYFSLLSQQLPKKIIWINSDALPFIFTGKSILAPGIQDNTLDIIEDDYCLILYKKEEQKYCVGIGIAKTSSDQFHQMMNEKKGFAAKNKEYATDLSIPTPYTGKKQDLYQVNKANLNYIKEKINFSLNFIKNTSQKEQLPIAVGYSGGKDSLCVLLLVWKAIGSNFKIFFADTGLELPEVVKNVHDIAEYLKMEEKLIIKSAKDKFWHIIQEFGPPAKDFRFCCHTLKAQQIMEIINTIYDGKKVVVFLGQRKYESLNRSREKMVYVNSFIPLQVAATPIKDWNALLVWLFLLNPSDLDMEKEYPITDLYFKGQERLGCYLCPAMNLSGFTELNTTHPELYNQWLDFLNTYAQKYNYPKEWITYGIWRYKNIPPIWQQFLKKHQLSIPFSHQQDQISDLELKISKGYSPCIQGGYSVKGKLSQPINLAKILSFLTPLAPSVEYDEELNVITLKGTFQNITFRSNLFSDGSLFLQSNNQEFESFKWIQKLFTCILHSFRCNQCHTCENVCLKHAINLNNTSEIIDPKKCIHCLKCITHCPLYALSISNIKNFS